LKKKSINELILSEKTEMVSYVAKGQTNEIGETKVPFTQAQTNGSLPPPSI